MKDATPFPFDLLHPCLRCMKHYGTHKALTSECPKGSKARIGYTSFGPGVFEPLPGWGTKEGTFKL